MKDISWRGWGGATAIGHGTAEADDCRPDCADGTYTAHPAMLTLTDPKPWHGKMAYSRVAAVVSQTGWHESFTRGLLPSQSPQPSQAVTSPPAPGPVSTQATASGTCVMGYVKDTNADYQFNGPLISKPRSVKIGNTIYTAARAYRVTLAVTSPQTADVAGFAVVFYDANGQETGSDQESIAPTLITSGQSLSWTEVAKTDLAGSTTDGTANIPAGSVTCQFVQWYRP